MKRRDLILASSGLSVSLAVNAANAQSGSKKMRPTALKGKTVQISQGLSGYYVTPSGGGTFPSVVVIMEAFGLNDYIKSVCDRFAKVGYAALAPDFYHGDTYEYSDLKGAIAKLKSLKDDVVMAEFGKGLGFLAQKPELKGKKTGVIGFCMGGRYTFLANEAHASELKAAVAFYGAGIAPAEDQMGRPSLLGQVEAMQAPIMLMYGADDNSISAEEHQRIALALSQAKKRYSMNIFPKAGHGFFCDQRDSYSPEASAEAWTLTLNFFERYLKA